MTRNHPWLVSGPTLIGDDPTRASAVLRFPKRELSWVGEVSDGWHGSDVAALQQADIGDQRNFAGTPFADAWASSGPIARHILRQIMQVYERSFGAAFAAGRVLVTVRIDKRVDYSQAQGAHVDWARLKEFHPREWAEDAPRSAPREPSLGSLARCHSIDCVLGGPPTEYLPVEQDGTVFLSRESVERPWIVTGIDFSECGAPQSGLTGALVYRPPFTVHQFPSRHSWHGDNPMRLFVSCDYWSS